MKPFETVSLLSTVAKKPVKLCFTGFLLYYRVVGAGDPENDRRYHFLAFSMIL